MPDTFEESTTRATDNKLVCAICCGSIKKYQRKITLVCLHVFHQRCVKSLRKNMREPKCPICSRRVLDCDEYSALKSHDERYLKETVKSMAAKEKDLTVLLGEAIENDHRLLYDVILSYLKDGTISKDTGRRMLALFIDTSNASAIRRLSVEDRCLNWHCTYNGETMLERARKAVDREIYSIVSRKLLGNAGGIYPSLDAL